MELVDRLEKRAKELDQQLKYGVYTGGSTALDDRELLDETARYLRQMETERVLNRVI